MAINPEPRDIGRAVVYRAGHPNAQPEEGVITSYNEHSVFVRYMITGTPQGTSREDLEWLWDSGVPTPAPTTPATTLALRGLIQAASLGEAHLHRAYTSLASRVAIGLPVSVTEVARIRHVHADLSAALAAYDEADKV